MYRNWEQAPKLRPAHTTQAVAPGTSGGKLGRGFNPANPAGRKFALAESPCLKKGGRSQSRALQVHQFKKPLLLSEQLGPETGFFSFN
jgi:hypothetical protein